jgi:hypothetical protein
LLNRQPTTLLASEMLSACNTAAGGSDDFNAQALSGFARAFFYAAQGVHLQSLHRTSDVGSGSGPVINRLARPAPSQSLIPAIAVADAAVPRAFWVVPLQDLSSRTNGRSQSRKLFDDLVGAGK